MQTRKERNRSNIKKEIQSPDLVQTNSPTLRISPQVLLICTFESLGHLSLARLDSHKEDSRTFIANRTRILTSTPEQAALT